MSEIVVVFRLFPVCFSYIEVIVFTKELPLLWFDNTNNFREKPFILRTYPMLGTKKHSKQKAKILYLKYFEQYWRNSVKNKLEKLNESCQKKKVTFSLSEWGCNKTAGLASIVSSWRKTKTKFKSLNQKYESEDPRCPRK